MFPDFPPFPFSIRRICSNDMDGSERAIRSHSYSMHFFSIPSLMISTSTPFPICHHTPQDSFQADVHMITHLARQCTLQLLPTSFPPSVLGCLIYSLGLKFCKVEPQAETPIWIPTPRTCPGMLISPSVGPLYTIG